MPNAAWHRKLPHPWNVMPVKRRDKTLDKDMSKSGIRIFSGEPSEYFAWRASVISYIHRVRAKVSVKIGAVQKVLDPKDKRTRKLVPAMDWDAGCYFRLICNLETRFGGEERLIAHHLKEVRTLSKISKDNSAELDELINTLTEYFDVLGSYKRIAEIKSMEFYSSVLTKLPYEYQDAFQLYHVTNYGDAPEGTRTLYQWLGLKLKIIQKKETAKLTYDAVHHPTAEVKSGAPKKLFFVQDENGGSHLMSYDDNGEMVLVAQNIAVEDQHKETGKTVRFGGRLEKAQPRSWASSTSTFKKSESGQEERRNRRYFTEDGQDRRNCGCETLHRLHECSKFLALTPSDRRTFCNETGRCYRCLFMGHSGRECKQRSLKCAKCPRMHNTLLHGSFPEHLPGGKAFKASTREPESEIDYEVSSESEDELGDNYVHMSQAKDQISLRIIALNVTAKDGSMHIFNALLDEGAQGSYLSERARAILDVSGVHVRRRIIGVGNTVKVYPAVLAKIRVRGLEGRQGLELNVTCIPNPLGDLEAVNWQEAKHSWEHLRSIPFTACSGGVDILIGSDAPEVHRSLDEKAAKGFAPVARRGILGWTASGPINPRHVRSERSLFSRVGDTHCFLQRVRRRWR